VAAEDILPIRNERYARLIEEARNTENWKIRAKLNRKAVDDLINDRYWKNG